MIASARRSNTECIGSNFAVSRHSYHWLMTKHAWVKKKIVADNERGGRLQRAGSTVAYYGNSCSSYPAIRNRYSRMREEMIDKIGIPTNIQSAIMANHEPNEKGVYPDWADKDYVFKYPEVEIVNLFEIHRSAAIHWFQNGHPMKSWVTNSEELLGVSEKQAEMFSKEWYILSDRKPQLCGNNDRTFAKGTRFQNE